MDVYSIKNDGNEVIKASVPLSPVRHGSSKKIENSIKAGKIRQNASSVQQKSPDQTKVQFPKMLEIAKQVGEKLKSANVNIQFEVSKNKNRIIIKVLDPVSGEVIRKIPPDEYMKSFETLGEMKNKLVAQGIGVDVKY